MELKEIYDLPHFHGILTDEEAYNLCREELTNTGKNKVYIWHLSEINGELQGRILRYVRDSEVPILRYFPQSPNMPHLLGVPSNYVFRKNPIKLQELARIAILDSFVDYCCLNNLIKRIDELQLIAMEKEELKKLVRGFKVVLASKIPNELYELFDGLGWRSYL